MFPIKDDNPTERFPAVTVFLIVANAAVFLLQIVLPPPVLEGFIRAGAIVPARFSQGDELHGAVSLLTSQFLHGGLLHIGGNMLYLWIFGNNVEDWLGRGRFLLFYLGCGAVAGSTQALLDPFSDTPIIGASGAIAGVLGAYLILYPRARVHTLVLFFIIIRIIPVPAAIWLAIWFLFQVVAGVASLGQESGVAWWAHAGGFLGGLLVIRIAGPRWKRRPKAGGFRDGGWTGHLS